MPQAISFNVGVSRPKSRTIWRWGVLFLAVGLWLSGLNERSVTVGQPKADSPPTTIQGQLSTAAWRIEFQLSAAEFAALEPPAAPGFPGAPGPATAPGPAGLGGPPTGGQQPAAGTPVPPEGTIGIPSTGQGSPAGQGGEAEPARDFATNALGTRFPWVTGRALIHIPADPDSLSGQPAREIQAPCRLRYDGDFTYLLSAAGPKRPLLFELLPAPHEPAAATGSTTAALDGTTVSGAVSDDAIEILGRAWRLQTMQFDPTHLRQRMAVHVAAALGVPTPKVTHAEVFVRIGDAAPRLVGLYTLLESVDDPFLSRHAIPAASLRLQLTGLNSLNFMGEQWLAYAAAIRPQRPATVAEQQRVMALARLISSATEQEFHQQIGNFFDVEDLLRYLAAQAITANVTGFSTLGVNDWLCLDLTTGRFRLVANEWETALGSAALSGTPEQLADLSVLRPFAGPSPLVERLLSDPSVLARYQALLRSSAETWLSDGPVAEVAAALATATQRSRAEETKAAAERQRIIAAAGGFAFGGPPPGGPPPMEVHAFLSLRRNSLERQRSGATGFVPSLPDMGGFGRREGAPAAISDREFRDSVQVPQGFQATLFARSPEVNYPVAIAAEPTGAIYVGIDEQGSLGTSPGGGRVVRCVDSNGDGVMDDLTVFCRVDHVRGVAYRDGQVWVSHPPLLSVFRDLDGDGVADEQQVLVRGLTTEMVETRGGDHTTNGVRFGIDGWLYIGAGDYGVPMAEGRDGSTVVLRGGGILRVRPDGTELELVASGLRNPFDIAIDPFLNLFTRDNTNDGGGWDTRISQLHDSAEYGYPRLFANFSDEIMPTLGTFGGGGGTGGLYIEDPAWPESLNRSLFTGDWGRSAVFHHRLQPDGPTFAIDQSDFVVVPRATGMDLDAQGNLYIASWWSGEASVYVGPHVGFVTRVRPEKAPPAVVPNFAASSLAELIEQLRAPQAVVRFHAQGEWLRRGADPSCVPTLERVIQDATFPLAGRVAALFALKQLRGNDAHAFLIDQLSDPSLREFVIRALADRRTERSGLDCELFLPFLEDPNPRVVAQAVIALGRLGDSRATAWLLPLADYPFEARPDPAQPNSRLVIPHLAVQAIVRISAGDECLAAVDGPYWRAALRALRQLPTSPVVQGLVRYLSTARDLDRRTEILATLIRLYRQETPYDGSWWGIRPDTTGPVYDPLTWQESPQIEQVVRRALESADPATQERLRVELRRHQIEWEGVSIESSTLPPIDAAPIVIAAADPGNPRQIGNLNYAVALQQTLQQLPQGDPQRGARLFQSHSCSACHTSTPGQQPVGPHLADIGQRYQATELIESILKPSEKIAQGYETQMLLLATGELVSGFVISESGQQIWLRDSQGITHKILRTEIEERRRQPISAMPEGLVGSLEPTELADLIAFLQSL